ncbi:MAG TPA: hypothetical protein VIR16_08660 [Candidatus Limnocylindrales bacterium]
MTDSMDGRRCAWCEAMAPAEATRCPKCDAALAQREDLGGMLIPGVTGVHPDLAAAKDRPLHLAGPSRAQGVASGLLAAAAAPGPAGLVVGAGIAAIATAEYLGVPSAGLDGHPDPATVGLPSESALRMVERLEAEDQAGAEDSASGSGE